MRPRRAVAPLPWQVPAALTRATTGAFGVALVLSGCAAPSNEITAIGRVNAESVPVQAPALAVPAVNLNAGFVISAQASANNSPVPALLGFGSGQRVSAVEVKLGQSVRAGDILVRFDDTALGVQVQAARADRSVAKAQVRVIDAAIDETRDAERELKDKRAEVRDGIAKAARARSQVIQRLAQARKAAEQLPRRLATVSARAKDLRAKLAQVESQLAQAEAALATLPPGTPQVQRDPLLRARAQLRVARDRMRSGLRELNSARQLRSGIAQVRAGIPQLNHALATIDANLAKARSGLRAIDRGLDRVRDARADLRRTRKLAVIAAADTSSVEIAKQSRAEAVVRAPEAGLVTSLAQPGDVVAPGAGVATLGRPASTIRVWLDPDQVARICVGDPAAVSTDSLGEAVSGTVARILPEAIYPPTYTTTDRIHMTRAVPVEITAERALPAGVPADIRLSPCRTTR